MCVCLPVPRPSGTEDVVRVYAEAETQVGQYAWSILLMSPCVCLSHTNTTCTSSFVGYILFLAMYVHVLHNCGCDVHCRYLPVSCLSGEYPEGVEYSGTFYVVIGWTVHKI